MRKPDPVGEGAGTRHVEKTPNGPAAGSPRRTAPSAEHRRLFAEDGAVDGSCRPAAGRTRGGARGCRRGRGGVSTSANSTRRTTESCRPPSRGESVTGRRCPDSVRSNGVDGQRGGPSSEMTRRRSGEATFATGGRARDQRRRPAAEPCADDEHRPERSRQQLTGEHRRVRVRSEEDVRFPAPGSGRRPIAFCSGLE